MMEYKFKSYEPKSWKLYKGWVVLKMIPKFAYTLSTLTPKTPNAPVSDLEFSSVDTSGIPTEASSRDSGCGQKAAIVAKVKAEKENKKRERERQREGQEVCCFCR